MARLLALEWDDREVRIALATTKRKGEEAVVDDAFAVPLDVDRSEATPEFIGGKLQAALSARGVKGRVECLVALGRSSIELRQLTLPPCPEDELPALVRFQAMKEFNAFGDDWPLDYLPVSGSATEPRNVLAAAIAPDLVKQINSVCAAAHVKPKRLILRACAAAALLRRAHPPGTEHVRLLVDLLTDEADLTLLVDDAVVFLRTARLPGEPGSPEQNKAMLAEIRRTMVAAQNRLGGGSVQTIFLCGGPAQEPVAAQLSQDLSLPCRLFHPFEGQAVRPELMAAMPDQPGRFAPLVGMLLDEAAATPHAVDFLHPHRPPEPPSTKRRWVAVGAVAATLLVAWVGWTWYNLADLDGQIAAEVQKKNQMETTMKNEDKAVRNKIKSLDKWRADDIVWLDELKYLSTKLPKSEIAQVTSFNASPRSGNVPGGEVQLSGKLQKATAFDELNALADAKHRIEGGKVDEPNRGAGARGMGGGRGMAGRGQPVTVYSANFQQPVIVEK